MDGPEVESGGGEIFRVQADPGFHPAFYIMGTGSFPRV